MFIDNAVLVFAEQTVCTVRDGPSNSRGHNDFLAGAQILVMPVVTSEVFNKWFNVLLEYSSQIHTHTHTQ